MADLTKDADGFTKMQRAFLEAYLGPANYNATKAAKADLQHLHQNYTGSTPLGAICKQPASNWEAAHKTWDEKPARDRDFIRSSTTPQPDLEQSQKNGAH